MSTQTVLPFGGGELSSFDPQDNGCFETTTAGVFDPLVSRCAISIGSSSAGFKSPTWMAAADFWLHAVYWPSSDNSGSVVKFFQGATVVAQFFYTSQTIQVQTRQGGVLTTVGTLSLFLGPTGARNTIDVRFVAGASGRVTGYLAGTQIFDVTGLDHAGWSGITQIQCLGTPSGFTSAWSQIICDTLPHVGDSLVTIVEDTASVINTGWSGAVTAINEVVLDDSHSVASSAAGDVSTYYKNAASLGTWRVVAICIGARAQRTAGSSTNLQICLRTNGTNYFGPTTALDFGFQAVCASWVNNPFTAAPWDTVTAAAVEVGMKSVA